MKKLVTAMLLLFTGLGLTLPAYAWDERRLPDGERIWRYDLISLRGEDLGNVYVNHEGEDIKMDFDFDNNPACTVQTIMFEDRDREEDFHRLAWGYLDPDRFDFKEGVGYRKGPSYIEPRDAVLYFDRDWHEDQDRTMASAVRFTCPNNEWQLGFVGDRIPRQDTAARYFVITPVGTYKAYDPRIVPAQDRDDDAWKNARDQAREWYKNVRSEWRQEYKELRQERRERDQEWREWKKEHRADDTWKQKKEEVSQWYRQQKEKLDEKWEKIKAEYRQRKEAWHEMRDEA